MTARSRRKAFDWPKDERSARMQRHAEETRRFHCDLIGCWQGCTNVDCRRSQTCTGDPQFCFDRGWAAMPEDLKEFVLGGAEAAFNGVRANDQIIRAAHARRAEHLKLHG